MTFIHLHRCVETPWNRADSYTDLRERLDGKPRNITIQPRIHEVAVMVAVAAAIGFWLAVGHS
jgi:hypothetical protein